MMNPVIYPINVLQESALGFNAGVETVQSDETLQWLRLQHIKKVYDKCKLSSWTWDSFLCEGVTQLLFQLLCVNKNLHPTVSLLCTWHGVLR